MADYGVLWGEESPGCLVDSTKHNIDGSPVCGESFILTGKIVGASGMVDGYLIATDKIGESVKPFGVALRSFDCRCSKETDGYMAYKEGDAINVATMGLVWALTESIGYAPEFGQSVYASADGLAEDSGDAAIDGWKFSGDFVKYDENYNIVGILINHA